MMRTKVLRLFIFYLFLMCNSQNLRRVRIFLPGARGGLACLEAEVGHTHYTSSAANENIREDGITWLGRVGE